MNRYKKANEGIHAPEEVKEKAIRPGARRTYSRWMGTVAAVLAVALIGGAALWPRQAGQPEALAGNGSNEPAPLSEDNPPQVRSIPGETNGGAHHDCALAEAVYQLPETETPPMPSWADFAPGGDADQDAWDQADAAWREAFEAWRRVVYAAQYRLEENSSIDGFVSASTAQILTGAGAENRIYSPLNLYMALAMLAETSGGESRRQILDVLGAESIEALREDAATVWQNYYQDDDMGISVMANSLWLRDDMAYSQDTLDTLARSYYASTFAGEMGSAEYNQALRDWINEQTRGLLEDPVQGLEMTPETVLSLASTVYFKAAWGTPFSPELNTRGVFHAPSGDVEVEFLNRGGEWSQGMYYWGEHFSSISLDFQASNYEMWLILPDEGNTVDDLIESGEAMEFLLSSKYGAYDEETGEEIGGWPDKTFLRINLSLPKFDVSSDLELADGLNALGATDVFEKAAANFDPLGASTTDPIYVSQARHAARVMIDEEGCTAASYVDLMLVGAGMPPDEEVDFTLDRPFLFAITGISDLPLFVGVVNQP